MRWGAAPILLLPASGLPAFLNGSATIPLGVVTTISSGTVIVNGALVVSGTLVLGPGAVIQATSVLIIGALNVSASGASVQSSSTFSIQPSAVLTVVVSFNPGTNSSIAVVIAQFASFGGGSFDNTSSQAAFSGSQCVQLGTPIISSSATALTASISVQPLSTVPGCPSTGSGGLPTGALIGVIVGCVVGGILVALAIVLLLVFMRKKRTQEIERSLRAKEFDRAELANL